MDIQAHKISLDAKDAATIVAETGAVAIAASILQWRSGRGRWRGSRRHKLGRKQRGRDVKQCPGPSDR